MEICTRPIEGIAFYPSDGRVPACWSGLYPLLNSRATSRDRAGISSSADASCMVCQLAFRNRSLFVNFSYKPKSLKYFNSCSREPHIAHSILSAIAFSIARVCLHRFKNHERWFCTCLSFRQPVTILECSNCSKFHIFSNVSNLSNFSYMSGHNVQLNDFPNRRNLSAIIPGRTTCHVPCRLRVHFGGWTCQHCQTMNEHCCAILHHVGVLWLLLIILASWTGSPKTHYFDANTRYGVHPLDHLYRPEVVMAVKLHHHPTKVHWHLQLATVDTNSSGCSTRTFRRKTKWVFCVFGPSCNFGHIL